MKKHPLLAFFVLAYGFFVVALLAIGGIVYTWPVSPQWMNALKLIASWTPNMAVLVVVGANGGAAGIRKLVAGWGRWRVHWGWYVFGLAPLALTLVVAMGYGLLGNSSPGVSAGLTMSGLFSMIAFNLLQGATGEELGWRGFALPQLQTRYSRLAAAIILGLLIAGWHSVLHLIEPVTVPEWQFWLVIVCQSVLLAWSYNRTGGSLLIVSLFHFSANFGAALVINGLGLISLEGLFWGSVAFYVLATLGVLWVEGRQFWQKPAVGVMQLRGS